MEKGEEVVGLKKVRGGEGRGESGGQGAEKESRKKDGGKREEAIRTRVVLGGDRERPLRAVPGREGEKEKQQCKVKKRQEKR